MSDSTDTTDGPSGFSATPGSALYGVRLEVVGDDRLSCSAHLRRVTNMIMMGDARGWTSGDINGSCNADRFTPEPNGAAQTEGKTPVEVADNCEMLAIDTTDNGDRDAAELFMEPCRTIRRLLRTLARLNHRSHINYDFNADPDGMTLEVGEALKGYKLK